MQKLEKTFAERCLDFDFRYRCTDCTHLNRDDLKCSLEYPNRMLMTPSVEARDEQGVYVFCKFFELED